MQSDRNKLISVVVRLSAVLVICLGAVIVAATAATAERGLENRVGAVLGERALKFEANHGQFDASIKFVARGAAYAFALTPTEVVVQLRKPNGSEEQAVPTRRAIKQETADIRIQFVGAEPAATMQGLGPMAGRANYLIGNDASRWQLNVPSFERVRVAGVYPGIDVLHYGNQRQLEYDFEVAPGANPEVIALKFFGAQRIEISEEGDLVLRVGADELRQLKPVAYQNVDGKRKTVEANYRLADGNVVKFALGDYDSTLPLLIDPVVSYAAYLNGPGNDRPLAVAIGPDGDIYLTGDTLSASGFATPGAFQTNLAGAFSGVGDVFISRHKNDSALTDVYVTYLGGSGDEVGFALAVDDDGNAYVTGYTASTNFPTQSALKPSIQTNLVPGFPVPAADAFIAKLGPEGTNLVFSTFYGGDGSGFSGLGDDVGRGIALDAARNVYVVGYTGATNFPASAMLGGGGFEDAFLLKLDPSGSSVAYSLRIGGANRDFAQGVAIDANGDPVVVGYTASADFPVTTNAFQYYLNQSTNVTAADDAFVVRFDQTDQTFYATFLGGTNSDRAFGVATDATGAVYVAGRTFSGDFPRTSTNLPTAVISNVSFSDVFVTKFSPFATNLVYSAVFGGAASETAWGIAVDGLGQAHVTGETTSLNFPTNDLSGILRGTNAGGTDAFLAQLSSDGTVLNYSGYLGGTATDRGTGIALDSAGNAYFIGETIYGTTPIGVVAGRTDGDGYVVKILGQPLLTIAPAGSDIVVSWPGFAPEFTLEINTNQMQPNGWTAVDAIPVFTNGAHVVKVPASNAPGYFRLIK